MRDGWQVICLLYFQNGSHMFSTKFQNNLPHVNKLFCCELSTTKYNFCNPKATVNDFDLLANTIV